MFAIALLPILVLWGADNHQFFERLTTAEWNYVGETRRQPGLQPDGAYALTLKSGGESFILFKQRPAATDAAGSEDAERAVAGAD